ATPRHAQPSPLCVPGWSFGRGAGDTPACHPAQPGREGLPWPCDHPSRIGVPGVTMGEGGVPIAGGQKTTLRTFTVEGEEQNEGLRPRIAWTKPPCIFYN